MPLPEIGAKRREETEHPLWSLCLGNPECYEDSAIMYILHAGLGIIYIRNILKEKERKLHTVYTEKCSQMFSTEGKHIPRSKGNAVQYQMLLI